jgi:3-methyladenine DNA glycosylase/8-oxoguanine DNA glycosylase
LIVRVTQVAHQHSLRVTIAGNRRNDAAVLGLVRQVLGTDRDLRRFYRAAAHVPWLAPLVKRMRGVKPPRYPTLWEACANAIVFQQLSIRAASAIMQRLIVAVGQCVQVNGVPMPLYLFPTAERFHHESDERLRSTGLSANKIATLRRVAEAIESGALDAATLERCTSPDGAAMLRGIKGIGPWTATIILLRGLGRLDVFPGNDTSVARNIALAADRRRLTYSACWTRSVRSAECCTSTCCSDAWKPAATSAANRSKDCLRTINPSRLPWTILPVEWFARWNGGRFRFMRLASAFASFANFSIAVTNV